MTDDEHGPSLIAALRGLGTHVADAIREATGTAALRLTAGAMRIVLVLTAVAASTCIGVVCLVRGVHAVVTLLVGSGVIADLLIGIILTGWPVMAIALVRRWALQRAAPAQQSGPPPAPADPT